jgi:hypothetical protein
MATKKKIFQKTNIPPKNNLIRLPRVPNGSNVKFVAQTIRLTDAENERIKRAAKKQGMTNNSFCVYVLNQAADMVLTKKESEMINGTTASE